VKTFANVLWLLFAGIWLFIGYVFAAVVMSLLIITIPFAVQNFKLAFLALAPFGKEIVSNEEAQRRRGLYQAAAIGPETPPWPAAPPPPGTPYPAAPAVSPALLPPPSKDIGF
jgi:hypothetical protein